MKTVISTLSIFIILLAALPAKADTVMSDAKMLFYVVFRLEENIPFRKKVVQRIVDCKLHRRRGDFAKGSSESKEYSTRVIHKRMLNQLTLLQTTKPTSSFKGKISLKLNETAEEATMSDVCATFGDPDRESDSMVADVNADAQPHALIYDRKWGTLIFNIARTRDHRVLEVVMQAGEMPGQPLTPPLKQ